MKSLRKLVVVALIVVLAVAAGTMGLTAFPGHVAGSNYGSFYLAGDGIGEPPFFPPPSHNSITPGSTTI